MSKTGERWSYSSLTKAEELSLLHVTGGKRNLLSIATSLTCHRSRFRGRQMRMVLHLHKAVLGLHLRGQHVVCGQDDVLLRQEADAAVSIGAIVRVHLQASMSLILITLSDAQAIPVGVRCCPADDVLLVGGMKTVLLKLGVLLPGEDAGVYTSIWVNAWIRHREGSMAGETVTLRLPAVCSSSWVCQLLSTDSGHTISVARGPSTDGGRDGGRTFCSAAASAS